MRALLSDVFSREIPISPFVIDNSLHLLSFCSRRSILCNNILWVAREGITCIREGHRKKSACFHYDIPFPCLLLHLYSLMLYVFLRCFHSLVFRLGCALASIPFLGMSLGISGKQVHLDWDHWSFALLHSTHIPNGMGPRGQNERCLIPHSYSYLLYVPNQLNITQTTSTTCSNVNLQPHRNVMTFSLPIQHKLPKFLTVPVSKILSLPVASARLPCFCLCLSVFHAYLNAQCKPMQ